MFNPEIFYSESAKSMKASVIRELLKLTRKPGIISFAGGLPAPETFPAEKIKEITSSLIETKGSLMMQYGPTEGDPDLKEQILDYLKEDNPDVELTQDNILVTTASQQGLDIIGKLFINPGDSIMVGLPSYLGALQAFNAYRCEFIGAPLDDNGIMTDEIEKIIKERKKNNLSIPKFIYVIPDFQNPAGICMSLERRKALIKIAETYNITIIEDSPYKELRYEGKSIPSILSLDKNGHVISLFTFSKTMLPGLRLGWAVSRNTSYIQKLTIIKQAVDLCTPPFTQAIAAEFLKRGFLKSQIKNNVAFYKQKQKAMLEVLDKYMPKLEGLKWTKPEGGMFLWLTLPEHMNADELFVKAVDEKVAYVIGSAFYCNGKGQNTMRINFSYPTLAEIEEGIKRLANVIEKNAGQPKERSK